MMDSSTALARVGLLDPGGNPAAISADGYAWQDLARHLNEHVARLQSLAAIAPDRWRGPDADLFAARTAVLANQAAATAAATSATAAQQREHANTHRVVLEILKEIGIQIAATLAFFAASAAFPFTIAVAESWLLRLAAEGSRLLELLVRSLSAVIRMLVRTRAWIEQVMQLSLRTESFTIGYGRMVTEFVRDFTIDTLAGTVAPSIQGKPIDVGQLFKNALIGGLVGSGLGGLERSGITKVLNEADEVVRGLDGKPVFITLSDQAKSAVKSVGRGSASESSESLVRYGPKTRSDALFDDLTSAQARARREQVFGHDDELPTLIDNLTKARGTHRAAVQQQRAMENAQQQLIATALQCPENIAARHLRAAEETVLRAKTEAVRTAKPLAAHFDRLQLWLDLVDARAAVREGSTTAEQWLKFNSRKVWQETLLYDTPRYYLKGFVSNALKTATDLPAGQATPDDVWRSAVIGGTTSSLRGAFNSMSGNRFFPQYGIEETVWKSGLKSLDNVVVGELRTHLPNHEESGQQPEGEPDPPPRT
jgi:hypothetical protein